jgi:hypothetical protein
MLAWNQYTDWPSMRAAGERADELGYDDLWTWDQLPSSTSSSAANERDMQAPQARAETIGP